MTGPWKLTESEFNPKTQNHQETIFTIGNGYLSTRGVFEEGFPGDRRTTFVHGVFDDVPIVFTELANAPDWLPLIIYLDGERFSLDAGQVMAYQRELDLYTGLLTRTLSWKSPSGKTAELRFERFASMADEHLLLLRCQVIPDFAGQIELQATLNGCTDNEGMAHWNWIEQGQREGAVYLCNRTRNTKIQYAQAMRLRASVAPSQSAAGNNLGNLEKQPAMEFWNVENSPSLSLKLTVTPGQSLLVEKIIAVATSRDCPDPLEMTLERLARVQDWQLVFQANTQAWSTEWERSDVIIEGDDEAQIAMRFNLFQLLIAAPRNDNRVNIGAKTLSGFGYRGHSFWDTEIFMLPLFTYTAPHIARNLLSYRHQRLPMARLKARANGYEGAQFPWESADTGEEVTPRWVPHFEDPTQLVRIWPGDIEIHISADIAYAAYQYWQVTGDHDWMAQYGAELILDTAKFWAARAEWNPAAFRYEYNNLIGPDEYHDRVDNNAYTNFLAQWNLRKAIKILEWLSEYTPARASKLVEQLELSAQRLDHWQDVIEKIYLPVQPTGLVEQFEGYFKRKYIDLAALEPRLISAQVLYGIEGCNETQVIKQPDVLMLQYLLPDLFSGEQVCLNYDYYTPRTDYTYGSSLGPSIQAIMACAVDRPEEAYEHFMRANRADLRDVRGNASDGIHAASAGGAWQAVVFGFAGLHLTYNSGEAIQPTGWSLQPRLPKHWKRLAFKFSFRGQTQQVDLRQPAIKGFIFDLDGVLTDTAEYHYRAWKRLADEEGLPFSREDNEALRGVSRRESLLLLLKGRVVPEEHLQEMMERKNRYYQDSIQSSIRLDLLPGVNELVNELRNAGYKMAIGSASKNTCQVLERLGIQSFFDAISDGYSVRQQKPAPDLFLHAAAQLGLAPEECIVVEDAAAGIAAAKAGGFHTVGIGPLERVCGAELILTDLRGIHLQDLLAGLKK